MVEAQFNVTRAAGHDSADPWVTLKVGGEVDILTSPVLEAELTTVLDEGSSSIVLDLEDVTFLDSTGLSVLLACSKRCQSQGGSIRLVSLQRNVRRVLEITGLMEVFQVQEDEPGTTP